jgi:parvulin-like peptidyl-prolyl isomerase
MKKLISFLLLAAAAFAATAQGLPALSDVRKVTDDVMTKVGKGDLEGGLKTFKSLTVIPEAEFDAMIGQATLQAPMMASRFGQVLGHEFIREDQIGESLARYVYIQRFEKHAMRWMFYLYRGKTGWVVNSFRFDDKWPDLF